MFPQRKACEKESSLKPQSKDIYLDNQNDFRLWDWRADGNLKNRVYNIYLEGKKKPRELLKTIRSNCGIHENGRLYTLYIKMSNISLINDSANLVEEAILF